MGDTYHMGKETVQITFLPKNIKVNIEKGSTILEAAKTAEIKVNSLCGGKHKCGHCKVRIIGVDNPPLELESQKISESETEEGYRLACLYQLHRDEIVEVPLESKEDDISILHEGIRARDYLVDSGIVKTYVELKQSLVSSQLSDLVLLESYLEERGILHDGCNIELIRSLPETLRSNNNLITCVLVDNRINSLEEGNTKDEAFGIAIDIGTTTIVGYLMCLLTGKEIGISSRVNAQRVFGSDVISRIVAASERLEMVQQLQGIVVKVINEIINELVSNSGIRRDSIYKMTVVGNTCMQHLFLGISPKYLALAPYRPVFTGSVIVSAMELGIGINPSGKIETLPSLAGFVRCRYHGYGVEYGYL